MVKKYATIKLTRDEIEWVLSWNGDGNESDEAIEAQEKLTKKFEDAKETLPLPEEVKKKRHKWRWVLKRKGEKKIMFVWAATDWEAQRAVLEKLSKSSWAVDYVELAECKLVK